MGDQKSHDIAEIEELLGVRQQLTVWLEKLDVAGSKAPESVRSKVRSDYRARLTQIVAQLATHGDVISSTLEGLRAQRREYEQSRAEEFEVRAEAELRHTVGEYTDDEWQLVELESSGKIEGFDQELARLQSEIARLEEVQGLIQPAPQRSAPPPPMPPSRPEPILVTHDPEMPVMLGQDPMAPLEQPSLSLVRDDEGPATPLPRPEAPRFVPRPGGKQAPVRSAPQAPTQHAPGQPQDELAFIRSVSLDSAPPSSRITQNPAPNAVGAFDKEDRPSQTIARTLKCAECGSLNRPTEWYCERCGAELAAL